MEKCTKKSPKNTTARKRIEYLHRRLESERVFKTIAKYVSARFISHNLRQQRTHNIVREPVLINMTCMAKSTTYSCEGGGGVSQSAVTSPSGVDKAHWPVTLRTSSPFNNFQRRLDRLGVAVHPALIPGRQSYGIICAFLLQPYLGEERGGDDVCVLA